MKNKNRKILIVSSPQEALAFYYIDKKIHITDVVICSYIGYSGGRYIDVVRSILAKAINVNIFDVSLYLIDRNRKIASLFNVLSNYRIINRFNNNEFEGLFYSLDNVLIGGKWNPLLGMNRTDNNVWIVDHSPVDGFDRVSQLKSKSNPGVSQKYLSRDGLTQEFLGWLLGAAKYAFKKYINLLFPLYGHLSYVVRGFSWIQDDSQYDQIQFKGMNFLRALGDDVAAAYPSFRLRHSVLLVDHYSCYKKVPGIYDDLKNIQIENEYLRMVQRDVPKDDVLLCKFHPYILDSLSLEEMSKYRQEIKNVFFDDGYKSIYFLDEILPYPLGFYPVEIFFQIFSVRSVLGIYSSTHVFASRWPNIKFISDCSFSPSFRELRAEQSKYYDVKFKSY